MGTDTPEDEVALLAPVFEVVPRIVAMEAIEIFLRS
jgi:hypothetical protein